MLTRLPPPHRAPGPLVRDFLEARFPGPLLMLTEDGYRELIPEASRLGLGGGAIYDALVAATARQAGARLITRDAPVYRHLGVPFELLE